MGPWLCSHGNCLRQFPIGSPLYALQWGRGCVATEIGTLVRQRAARARLQWGRGCVATEIGTRLSDRIRSRRFNGAVAV